MKKGFRKKLFKAVAVAGLAAAVGISPACPVAAASRVDVAGASAGNKTIEVTAQIEAAFVVSLPAAITLQAGSRRNAGGDDVPGYWYDLKVGAAGKLDSTHRVYIRPQLPCTLTGAGSGATVNMVRLNETSCTTETWDKDTIGSCDWGASGLINMDYSYCCTDGHAVGVAMEDISSFDSYSGTLTVNFGIEDVTP